MAIWNPRTKKWVELDEDEAQDVVWNPRSGQWQKAKKKDEDEDIAPVKESKKKDSKLDFFQKGAFSDGYQFGDALKTIGGTIADASVGIVKGAGRLVEGGTDLIVHGMAGVADLLGADLFADEARELAKKDTVGSLSKSTDDFLDDYSVLGRTSDSVAEGLGQVGAIILTGGAAGAMGLGTAGATALTTGTMGLSSMGSGLSEAYNAGASGKEALAYGFSKGAIDAGTELLFGGLGKTVKAVGLSKGISSLDDVFAQKLSSKIANRTAKNLVQFGVKASAEGFEEVLAGIGTAAAKKLTYMDDASLSDLIKDENLLEQFVVGAVSSGIAQSGIVPGMKKGSLIETTKADRDFITGFSTNEQKVLDSVAEKRIAEAEKNGEKLTKKEKNKIYDDVTEELQNGKISVDDIEEALGGETYKTYKDTVESEDSILKEFEELGKKTNPTLADQSRYAELQNQVKDIKENSKSKQLKAQLNSEVLELAKQSEDSYLLESYADKARRGQAFEADVKKYDVKQQKVIQAAIDSGILNNTRRTHEFVDMVAKISADKGVSFDFLNNEKLKNSSFAVDGKFVNGYLDKKTNTIGVNINSAKSLNTIVGHEISHVLEGTELYGEMQKAIFEYAKSKKDYDGRRKALESLYSEEDIDSELTADLVGDYLFSDPDFVKHLLTNHRNVFQKIYDEIKYLLKVVTAGSKEEKELLKVKKAFEDAYRADTKRDSEAKTEAKGEKKYSLSETTDGRFVAVVDNDILSNIDTSSWDKTKKDEAKKAASEALKKFKDGIVVDGITRKVNKKSRDEYTRSEYTESLYNHAPDVFADKMRAADVADDIVVATTNWNRDGGLTHPRDDNFVDFDHGTTLIMSGNAKYSAEVIVGITNKGEAVFYDVVDMIPTTFDIKKEESSTAATTQDAIGDIQEDASAKSISQKDSDVNTQFSLSSDTNGRQLSEGQKEYFKDSKVVDENGNLKVMYHGTSKGGFTVFDTYGSKYGLFGQGSYFTDNKSVAESYTNKGKGDSPTVYESYLNITNPMDMDAEADADAWRKAFPDASFPKSGTNEDFYRAVEDYFEDEGYYKYEAAEELVSTLESMGYDGITHIGGGRRNNTNDTSHRVYIAFNPEQIKNTDNTNPTENADIRYSLSASDKHIETTVTDYYSGEMFAVMTYKENGKVVGALDYSVYEDQPNVKMIEVAPEHRRKGIAKKLLQELQKQYPDTEINFGMSTPDGTKLLENITYTEEDKEVSSKLARINELQSKLDAYDKGYEDFFNNDMEIPDDYASDYNDLDDEMRDLKKDVGDKKPTKTFVKTYSDIRYSLGESEQANNDVKVMDGGTVTKYSLSTWTPETQTKVRENLIKSGYDADKVDKWIKDTNSVASVIAADKDRLDFVAADNQVMLKDNQEYIKTLDASTLCAKRLVYQGTFDAIQHRMPNTALSSDDLIDLLNMMKKHGVQTPCGVCYVESRRRHLGKFAQGWLDSYEGEYKPNLDEVTTSDGLEALRKSHPQTYKDFVDAMNKKGSSNPKVVQLRTEYRNEIMSLTPKQIRDIESIGGLRVQSFSDFETPHMLDMMQAVMDMSAKGLHSQAHTKVPNFAWVFGDTGIKINLSLIAEGDGFDADGNLAFSSTEGMDINEAMRLRDAYSQNVGTIIVGANDKHILAAMADDRIDFIIPFHRSGWGMKELEMMGMSSYTDYTYGQKEHDLATGKGVENLYPIDYWDYTLTGKENAERYLNLCAKTGREPKFSKFLVNNGDGSYSLQPDGSTDGYWKTLIDFKMYDNEGNGASQQKVQPNFNMDEAYRVLAEYEGGANKLPVANDVVEEFVAKYQSKELAPTMSLSAEGEKPKEYGSFNIYGEDVMLEEDIAPVDNVVDEAVAENATTTEDIAPMPDTAKEEAPKIDKQTTAQKIRTTRAELHQNKVDGIKAKFAEKGLDFDEALKKAKDLSTFSTVDNTPQRVMEKSLGYKEGQILADETVNKVAQNETEGIKWLNSFTDRKSGLLAKISKQYNIKPGSKESAAAQMYAEGFYVDDNGDLIKYGDEELAKDFPNAKVRENIKGLAGDSRIRQIYDDTLKAINESRARNAYPEIPRLDNYFLHFRAMDDTFSRLGLPFNPNDIRAKDLPADLNGVTADLKPGQPYFASAMHRRGQRTSFDLLGGLERYLSSAKNQIYHIDDIQTFRALRNYIADTYGQANGLEGLDALTEEEAQERIKDVYNSHLSTFAKFLNEEANVLAGKTALIDRGIEGMIGRRAMTFMDTLNRQVGSNMVGYNVSSALTNLIAPVQAFAKTNKFAFVKGFAQTVSNRIKSINGKSDGFTEESPVVIRRKGADRFHRTAWQKISDPGYALMGAVDNFSTELIARAKYNELTAKGMDSATAHIEADKWVSRLMGDRSLGQMPQLYNSKALGLITKFQLEVRNQLDSQFYDTIKEAEVSTEDIQNGRERNAKKAAKIASTFATLAISQHLFGKVFESIAGYNPAFDIIGVLIKALGLDDDEESEDTVLDNIEQGFMELMGDLPYTSILEGGRIPIASALPIEELYKGVDQYGNEKSRLETIKEALPYYLMPGGYGQAKKTIQGLSMFDEDHPIAGSYTDSGNLRFPVEDTLGNRIQAGIFGQWASDNARDYFDNEYAPLKEKQIQEFVDLDIPIGEYRKIRADLAKLDTLGEKAVYIANLNLPIEDKNLLINNIADREEPIDLTGLVEYGDFGEFEYAKKYPDKYKFLEANNISYEEYQSFDDDTKEAWSWAYQNPEKFALSKAVSSDLVVYKQYTKALNNIKADKDKDGDSISGSRKKKVIEYINELDADYGEKIILFKSVYNADDTYNYEIVDYLNSREDLSYEDVETILKELGFKVDSKGNISW